MKNDTLHNNTAYIQAKKMIKSIFGKTSVSECCGTGRKRRFTSHAHHIKSPSHHIIYITLHSHDIPSHQVTHHITSHHPSHHITSPNITFYITFTSPLHQHHITSQITSHHKIAGTSRAPSEFCSTCLFNQKGSFV